MALYPVLRTGAFERSPRRAQRDDSNSSSYPGGYRFRSLYRDLSIAQPPEVALLGASRVADTQTLTNTLCAAYLPNKAVSGRAPEDEEDAGLILLLEERPARWRGAPPTPVKDTPPARARRPTRRGRRGSPAFRRDRKIGGRSSVLPGAHTPEDGVTREGDLLGTDLGPPGAESRKRKTRRKLAAQG